MQDFLLDDDFDLLLDENGELVEGEAAQQEAESLVWESKGERKETPTVGFDVARWLKGVGGIQNVERFKRNLQVELSADGKADSTVGLNSDLSEFKIELNGD